MAEAVKLSLVIPVYNEVATLREIVERVVAVDLDKELVLVDDGSTDGSRELLGRAARPGARALAAATRAPGAASNEVQRPAAAAEHGQGRGAAHRVRGGHRRHRHHPGRRPRVRPARHPALIQPILDGNADVVFGSRFIGALAPGALLLAHGREPRADAAVEHAHDLNLTDMETCYKVFRREVIKAIVIEENRFGFEPELTAKVAKMRLRIYEVPVSYRGRTYEEGKKIGWKDGVRALYCIVKYGVRRAT